MALRHMLRNVEQIVFRNRDQHAIPSMDGALSPNDRLDACLPIGEALPDLVAATVGPDGALYATSGARVVRLDGAGFARRALFAELPGQGGGLAFHPDGRLLVCVAGTGLAAIDAGGRAAWLREAGGVALHCPTDVAAAPDGTIYLAHGSDRHGPDEWLRDLMEKRASGALVAAGADLATARTLRSGLHYPHGLAVAGGQLWFTESWNHRVSRAPLTADGIGATEIVIRNLPGYPARLGPAGSPPGALWLSLFGLRTQLIEFVLREDDYREAMMREVPPALWIGPAFASTGHYLEPLQGGGIKKLGIQKPWAPPRSYGLVVRIDETGRVLESLHSRVGGRYHGVTAVVETEQGLVIVSKGQNRLLLRPPGDGA